MDVGAQKGQTNETEWTEPDGWNGNEHWTK